jgi:hypothetical protein
VSVQYVVSTSNIALSAATAKTVIEGVTDASGPPPEWVGVDITFDGVTASAVPVRVDFCTYAATGTGTTQTPKKLGAALGTARSTWKVNDTVEPTTPVILYSWYIPPTSGLIGYLWPLGRELLHPLSTVQGIRLTAPAAVNAIVNLVFEE